MVIFLAMVGKLPVCLGLYLSSVSMQYLRWSNCVACYSVMVCLEMVVWESRNNRVNCGRQSVSFSWVSEMPWL